MCPSFIKIIQVVKKLNSISRERLNFRRRPILCTTLYRNLMQASNFGGHIWTTFPLNFFYEIFTEDASQRPLDPICKELSLTPLDHRWALKFAMLVRRCYMNQAPVPLCSKLQRTSHHRSTRGNNMSLHPFKPSSLSGILSFSNRSPILWNALQSVPNLCSLSLPKFKKVFTKLLLDSPKYISFAVGDVNRYTWCRSYILLCFLHFLVFSFFS